MKDIIVVSILLAIVAGIVWYLIREKRQGAACIGCPYSKQCGSKSSGGGCCSSSGYKLKSKKLSNVLYQKTFQVEGMHCEHCKNRVEEVVNDIKGVAGKVDLKKGELTVSYTEDVADELIKAKIARAGYTVIE